METPTTQRVAGDEAREQRHAHPDVGPTHDHDHVTHHHAGGPLGEFEPRSSWHEHDHDHAPLVHAPVKREVEDERQDHEPTAHIHDHNDPTDVGG